MARFFGSALDDVLPGTDGNDIFLGGAGADTITGGGGTDIVVYYFDPAGVTVDLGAGTATDGYGDADSLSGIEAVVGSAFADSLIGSSGDDLFYATTGGDTINGGMGVDTVSYRLSATGVTVDLMMGTGGQPGMMQDDLFMIENVVGSAQGDNITGSMMDNVLEGGAGDDVLLGLMGDDLLIGGDGDDIIDAGMGLDVMIGGAGADRFDFSTNHCDDGANIILDFEVGVDTIYVYDTPTEFSDFEIADEDGGAMIYLRGKPQLFLDGVAAEDFSAGDAIFV